MGCGFIFEGLLPLFWALLVAHVILGIGDTFISGAYQAWIADELQHANGGQTVSLGQVYLRGKQVNQLGGLLGIGVSVLLASSHLALPIIVSGVMYVGLGLFLILFMPENGFSPTPPAERESWRAMGRTVKDGMRMVRVRPILLTILAISAVYGMAGEGLDRLWAPHLLENFTLPPLGQFEPVVWFGIIQAGGMLLTIGATEIARRKLDTDSHRSVVRVLITANALLIGAVVLFGLSSGFVIALLAFWLVSVLRTTIEPLYIAWLTQNVDSKVRATMLSVNGLVNSIGEAGGGPIIGAIGTF
jgi:DHA3 family tetracycline resistance protein-like MFS transporter